MPRKRRTWLLPRFIRKIQWLNLLMRIQAQPPALGWLRHAPLVLTLWQLRRATPAMIALTLGRHGLGLASNPAFRAAVLKAAQKLRRPKV